MGDKTRKKINVAALGPNCNEEWDKEVDIYPSLKEIEGKFHLATCLIGTDLALDPITLNDFHEKMTTDSVLGVTATFGKEQSPGSSIYLLRSRTTSSTLKYIEAVEVMFYSPHDVTWDTFSKVRLIEDAELLCVSEDLGVDVDEMVKNPITDAWAFEELAEVVEGMKHGDYFADVYSEFKDMIFATVETRCSPILTCILAHRKLRKEMSRLEWQRGGCLSVGSIGMTLPSMVIRSIATMRTELDWSFDDSDLVDVLHCFAKMGRLGQMLSEQRITTVQDILSHTQDRFVCDNVGPEIISLFWDFIQACKALGEWEWPNPKMLVDTVRGRRMSPSLTRILAAYMI